MGGGCPYYFIVNQSQNPLFSRLEILELDLRLDNISILETYWSDKIIAACDKKTLSFVVSPANEGSRANGGGVGPDHQKNHKCHSWRYLLPRKTLKSTHNRVSAFVIRYLTHLHNHIVSIITYYNHSHYGAGAKDGSKTSIKFAS